VNAKDGSKDENKGGRNEIIEINNNDEGKQIESKNLGDQKELDAKSKSDAETSKVASNPILVNAKDGSKDENKRGTSENIQNDDNNNDEKEIESKNFGDQR
jgi:hypothetical protein